MKVCSLYILEGGIYSRGSKTLLGLMNGIYKHAVTVSLYKSALDKMKIGDNLYKTVDLKDNKEVVLFTITNPEELEVDHGNSSTE